MADHLARFGPCPAIPEGPFLPDVDAQCRAMLDAAPAAPYPVQRALFAPVRAVAEKSGDARAMRIWAGQSARLAAAELAGALAARLWAEARALLL